MDYSSNSRATTNFDVITMNTIQLTCACLPFSLSERRIANRVCSTCISHVHSMYVIKTISYMYFETFSFAFFSSVLV